VMLQFSLTIQDGYDEATRSVDEESSALYMLRTLHYYMKSKHLLLCLLVCISLTLISAFFYWEQVLNLRLVSTMIGALALSDWHMALNEGILSQNACKGWYVSIIQSSNLASNPGVCLTNDWMEDCVLSGDAFIVILEQFQLAFDYFTASSSSIDSLYFFL
jgi:hypothetical protein